MSATNANSKTTAKPTAAQKAGFPAAPKAPAKKEAAKKAPAKPAANKPAKKASKPTQSPAATAAAKAPARKRPAKTALPAPAAETQQGTDGIGGAAPAENVVTPQNHINAALAEASTLPVDVLSKTAMAFGAAALAQLGSGPTGANRPVRSDATGGRRAGDHTDGDHAGDATGSTGTTTKGTKVQKERPTQNGVTRQSPGSVGDQLWTAYDNHGGNPTLVEARALAKSLKLNETSASLALYQWRKFHGYGKTPVANDTPAAQ